MQTNMPEGQVLNVYKPITIALKENDSKKAYIYLNYAIMSQNNQNVTQTPTWFCIRYSLHVRTSDT